MKPLAILLSIFAFAPAAFGQVRVPEANLGDQCIADAKGRGVTVVGMLDAVQFDEADPAVQSLLDLIFKTRLVDSVNMLQADGLPVQICKISRAATDSDEARAIGIDTGLDSVLFVSGTRGSYTFAATSVKEKAAFWRPGFKFTHDELVGTLRNNVSGAAQAVLLDTIVRELDHGINVGEDGRPPRISWDVRSTFGRDYRYILDGVERQFASSPTGVSASMKSALGFAYFFLAEAPGLKVDIPRDSFEYQFCNQAVKRSGACETTREELKKACLYSDFGPFCNTYGVSLEAAGDFRAARDVYSRLASREAEGFEASYYRLRMIGAVLKMGAHDAADFQYQAMATDPSIDIRSRAFARFFRARLILERQQDPESALQEFTKGFEEVASSGTDNYHLDDYLFRLEFENFEEEMESLRNRLPSLSAEIDSVLKVFEATKATLQTPAD